MTDQRAFSQDEWETIRSTPLVAGLAVALATRSGIRGGLGELRTLLADIGRGDPGPGDTELVAAIIADHPRWHLSSMTGSDTTDPAAMLDRAVAACVTSRALLAERADPAELDQFHRWVVAIADDVAAACTEDPADSNGEQEAIRRLDAALAGRS